MSEFLPQARDAFDDGMPVWRLRRHFHLSDSELADAVPEAVTRDMEPEGEGGY